MKLRSHHRCVSGCGHAGRQPSCGEGLNSLPTAAKILIEQTRKSCREAGTTVTTGDDGLVQFYFDKSLAVLVDDYLLCSGECSPGVNCSNRGTRGVEIYVRRDGRWDHVLSEDSITGQIFSA